MLISKGREFSKDDIESMADESITELFCHRLRTWLLEPAKQLLDVNPDAGWVVIASVEKIFSFLDDMGLDDVSELVVLIEDNMYDSYVVISGDYEDAISADNQSIKLNPYLLLDLCDKLLRDLRDMPEAIEVIGFNFREFLMAKFNNLEE